MISRAPLRVVMACALALPAFASPALEPDDGRASAPEGRTRLVERTDRPAERARWNAMFRKDAEGKVDSRNRLRALTQACALPIDPSMPQDPAGTFTRSEAGPSARTPLTFGGVTWQPIGPRPIRSNNEWGDASGRIDALALHPKDPSVLLLGAATGGIWKSTDAGISWRPVSDSAPSLAISSIAFSRPNPSIVFAATGEADEAHIEYRASSSLGTYLGAGLLKSVDGGETWTRVDVDLPPNSVLSRVLPHPTNPQLVLVGVYIIGDVASNACQPGGVYQSTDGGVHFTRSFAYNVTDLVADPSSPDAVFAAFGAMLSGFPARDCPPPPSPDGVYRSTDFGATWTASLVPTTPGADFTSPTGNIRLGITRTTPAAVWASVLDTNDEHTHGGIYRSTDGGATWTKRATPVGACPDLVSQCWYDHWIAGHPTDPNTAYFGAINLWKSTDGGAGWTKLTDFYGSDARVHADQHAAVIVPSSPNTVYFAHDGGLSKTTDGGATFLNLNDTLTLAQFNPIGFHPVDPNFLFGGTQDNAILRFTNSLVWDSRAGGDGGFSLIRKDLPAWILVGVYYHLMEFSTDGGDSFVDVTSPNFVAPGDKLIEDISFYPPVVAAPTAPSSVFLGGQRVWANPLFGATPGDWTPRSEKPITTTRMTALEVVGDGSGPIWVGSSVGEVLFSTDGGATFSPRSSGLPQNPAPIVSKIRAVSADGRNAYLTLGGFTGPPSRHVFRTTDAGVSWVNITGNLPDAPATALAVDPTDPTDLFVASDVGVFRSTNGGATWVSYNQGLPNAPITDLAFHPVSQDLIASTYGRGAFRVLGPTSSGILVPSASFRFAPALPAPAQTVTFIDASGGGPTSWSWDFGDGYTSTERNPKHTYSQPGTYPITLTVGNTAGSSSKVVFLTVVSGAPNPVTLQVPVVLDAPGVAPTHFTSDLVAVNRSGVQTRLSITYLPAPGTPGAGGPTVSELVSPGHEWRIPDVIAYLRANGYAIPASGPTITGTLRLRFEDVSDSSLVFAGSRTSTPNPNTAVGGSFGLFASAVSTASAPSTSAAIYGLRQDTTARSNLAVVDVPGGTGPPVLSIQIVNGDTGLSAGPSTSVALKAGEWWQRSLSVLGAVKNGYAKITKTGGGSNRFIAYGVLNDGASTGGGTSDGSFLGSDASSGLVPVVLRVFSGSVVFTSELILVNPTAATLNVPLRYTPSALLGGGSAATGSITLGPNKQMRVPDAILWLRDTLGLPLKPGDVSQGGTLSVTNAIAIVRTSNANPDAAVGGSFGLAYPAVPPAARARTEAWIYGLVQDADTRSNLAIADARVTDPTSVTYVVDIFDSTSGDGTTPARTKTISLTGGQWYQYTKVLDGTGLTNANVRVRPQTGTSDFVVYGVLNDGASSGQRTSDGSYVAMSAVR